MSAPLRSAEIQNLYALLESGELNEVLRKGEALISRGRSNPDGNFLMLLNVLGASHLSYREFDKAHKYIDEGLSIDKNPHLLNTKASIFLKQTRNKDALDTIDSAIRLEGTNPEFYRSRAMILLACESYEELKRFVETRPIKQYFQYDYHLLKGACEWRLGNYEEGERNLEIAIGLDPLNSDAYLQLSIMHRINSDYEKVIKTLNRLGEDQFINEHFFVELGNAYYEIGQASSAIRCISRAVEINPINLSAVEIIAKIERDQGNFEKAKKRLENILALDMPEELQVRPLRLLAEVTGEGKVNDQAFRLLARAATLEADSIPQLELWQNQLNDSVQTSLRCVSSFLNVEEECTVKFICGLPSPALQSLVKTLANKTSSPIKLLEESAITNQHTGQTPAEYFWHPHSLLQLPKLLKHVPHVQILLVQQHPKDVCISNFSVQHEKTPSNSAFFNWRTTVAYIDLSLEILLGLQTTAIEFINIESLFAGDAEQEGTLRKWASLENGDLGLNPKGCYFGEWINTSKALAPYPSSIEEKSRRLGYVNV